MTHQILIVDDHPGIRQALKNCLSRTGAFAVIADIGRGADLAPALRACTPDLVILDLEMERGFVPADAVALIRDLAPQARIVVYSGHGELPLIERMTDLCVEGYILKTEKMAIVVHALETILAGERWISPTIALLLADAHAAAALTPTERTILQRLADGQNVRQIATQLHRSDRSVRGYVSSAVAKMKAKSREQAIADAVREGHIV
jgi:two-component system response regulator DesR